MRLRDSVHRSVHPIVLALAFLSALGCTDHSSPSASPGLDRTVFPDERPVEIAIDEFTAALALTSPEFARRVAELVKARRLREAVAGVEAVAQKQPTAPGAALLGALHLMRGDTESARAAFLRAVDLDGAYRPARVGLARVALARGDDAEAVRELERLLVLRPEDRGARMLLATALGRQNRYDEAVAVLEPSVLRDGAAGAPVVLLAELYIKSERPADAVARLRPLVDAEPALVDARLGLARALLAAGEAPAAALHLERLVTAGRASAEIHELAGRARLAAGDVARARGELARAVELDPRRFQARLDLARLAGSETTEAVLDAWTADVASRVRRVPHDVNARAELARVHALAGRREEAEREYRAALAVAPDLVSANLGLAALLLTGGRPDEAVPRLQVVVRASRAHRQANLLLAEHYEGRRQPTRAIAHLEAAYGSRVPLDGQLRLAWLCGQAGLFDAAIARARAAAAEAPRSAPAHTTLGRLLLLRGDATAAAAAFDTALAQDPAHAPAHFGLGSAWERVGDLERAALAWRKAAELVPREAKARYRLAVTYQRLGRAAEAEAELRRARELQED